jgi:DNA ligase-1
MLASTGASVSEAMSGFGCASVEWKLDGIRIQIHRRDRDVRIYTRNLNDITEALPGIAETALALPVHQAVFDGEAISVRDGRPAAFQETVSQIDTDAVPESVVTFLFDLLHVDGEDLLDVPLTERAARLTAIAPDLTIPGVLTTDPRDGERVLEASLEAGHEGVVVKDATSLYAAGRRGGAWRKVKPVRTYDLVVLGAEWGHGRRQGWLSNLHLGARDPRSGGFVMVGKTFKGLTDTLLRSQTQALLERETASRPRPVTRAGWRCDSRGSSATGPTSRRARRTRSTICAPCCQRVLKGCRPAAPTAGFLSPPPGLRGRA